MDFEWLKSQLAENGLLLVLRAIPESDLRLETDVLGQGGFGVVQAGKLRSLTAGGPSIPVAVKRLVGLTCDQAGEFFRELKATVLACGIADGVARMYGLSIVRGTPAIVMKRYKWSVADQIRRECRPGTGLPEARVVEIAHDVALALQSVHTLVGLVHNDLKPANILIDGDTGRAVIADWGMAAAARRSESLQLDSQRHGGTKNYMSPEQIVYEKAESPSDVWGLAATMICMLNGAHPFSGLGQAQIKRKLVKEKTPPAIPEHASHLLRSLLEWMLEIDPCQRPSIATVVKKLKKLRASASAIPRAQGVLGGDPANVSQGYSALALANSPSDAEAKAEALMRRAAAAGNGALAALLAKSAVFDVDARDDGHTALFIAAQSDDKMLLKALLDAEADTEVKDSNGWTALMVAACDGYDTCVRLLLDAEADKDASTKDGSCTPLFLASCNGQEACVRALLSHNADKDAVDPNGMTALMAASEDGHTACVLALLADGANMDVTNNAGYTALMLAVKNGHKDCVRALVENGAKKSK